MMSGVRVKIGGVSAAWHNAFKNAFFFGFRFSVSYVLLMSLNLCIIYGSVSEAKRSNSQKMHKYLHVIVKELYTENIL